MEFPPLYKETSAGVIQVFGIRTEGSVIISVSGQLDGKKTEHRVTVKNKKKSESLEKQAESEAASKWRDKRKSYWPTIAEAAQAGTSLVQGGYLPMLAHPFDKYGQDTSYFGQAKLDGVRGFARCIDGEVRMFSRKGLPMTTDSVQPILKSLSSFMEDGEIFDGEVYTRGVDFGTLSGTVRRETSTGDAPVLNYHVYDMPRIGKLTESDTFADRMKELGVDLGVGTELTPGVFFTPTVLLNGLAEIRKFHDDMVEDGYEGAILRALNMCYENKRSRNLLKYKLFQDDEFPIVGFVEGKGDLEGCVGSFTCETKHGKRFGVKLKAPEKVLADLFQHTEKFAGKHMTVKFQLAPGEDMDAPDWVPRFPIGKAFR